VTQILKKKGFPDKCVDWVLRTNNDGKFDIALNDRIGETENFIEESHKG
jgi:hypothetical protein